MSWNYTGPLGNNVDCGDCCDCDCSCTSENCVKGWGIALGVLAAIAIGVISCLWGFCADFGLLEEHVADHLDTMWDNGQGQGNLIIAYLKTFT